MADLCIFSADFHTHADRENGRYEVRSRADTRQALQSSLYCRMLLHGGRGIRIPLNRRAKRHLPTWVYVSHRSAGERTFRPTTSLSRFVFRSQWTGQFAKFSRNLFPSPGLNDLSADLAAGGSSFSQQPPVQAEAPLAPTSSLCAGIGDRGGRCGPLKAPFRLYF